MAIHRDRFSLAVGGRHSIPGFTPIFPSTAMWQLQPGVGNQRAPCRHAHVVRLLQCTEIEYGF